MDNFQFEQILQRVFKIYPRHLITIKSSIKLQSLSIIQNIIILIKSQLTDRTFSIKNSSNTIKQHTDLEYHKIVLGTLLVCIYISDI